MKQAQRLEARLNVTGGNDPCDQCGRWKERTFGTMEIYRAGTEDYLCGDCAYEIDPELARYLDQPNSRTSRRHVSESSDDGYFGLCPECRQRPVWRNIGRDHWLCCDRHGLKWWVGSNLISSWQNETEADWERNAVLLARFRETQAYHAEPPLYYRLKFWLIRFVQRISLRVRGDDCPF